MDSSKKTSSSSTTVANDSDLNTLNHMNINQQHRGQNILSDETTRKLNVLLEAINETAAATQFLNDELSKSLSCFDLEPEQLSREVNYGLDKIQAIMKKENQSEIDQTSMLIHLHERKIEELIRCRKEKQLKKKYEDFWNEYSMLQEKLNNIQGKVNSLTEMIVCSEDNQGELSNLIHKANKVDDYKRAYSTLEEELQTLHVSENSSQEIMNKYKQYMEASGELAQINENLNQYGDLPPDILQARAVVEQLEKRRQEVNRLLEDMIN